MYKETVRVNYKNQVNEIIKKARDKFIPELTSVSATENGRIQGVTHESVHVIVGEWYITNGYNYLTDELNVTIYSDYTIG